MNEISSSIVAGAQWGLGAAQARGKHEALIEVPQLLALGHLSHPVVGPCGLGIGIASEPLGPSERAGPVSGEDGKSIGWKGMSR